MPNGQLRSLIQSLYKASDGTPFILSDGQLKIAEFAKKLGVNASSIAGDDVGIGKGVCDRTTELLGVYRRSEEKAQYRKIRVGVSMLPFILSRRVK